MKKEHKEYIKLCLAIIGLWVVHKLINHQHHGIFEGADNDEPLPRTDSIVTPEGVSMAYDNCPWYKNIIGLCDEEEIQPIDKHK